jgi:hypothetical protein
LDQKLSTKVAAAIMRKLEVLPRQGRSFRLFDGTVLDWKLDVAWSRVALLASCAVSGLFVGALEPDFATSNEIRDTAITYVMPGLAACEP